jgi:hypothetical protein
VGGKKKKEEEEEKKKYSRAAEHESDCQQTRGDRRLSDPEAAVAYFIKQ